MAMFSVIVPVFQTPEILRLFLDSLKTTLTRDTDIIFVNDGSGYVVQTMLQAFQQEAFPGGQHVRVTALENHISLGSATAINTALRLIDPSCDYVVFLDSDTILQGRWQEELIANFASDDIGALGGVLLYPQSGGIQCCGLTYCGNAGRHLYLNANPNILDDTGPFDVQATVFAFCCVRRTIAEQVGLLDEHFFNGYEDLDYQFRLRKLGYRILTIPSIRHYHWEKSNGFHRAFNRKSNLGLFWKKHGDYVENDLFRFLACGFKRMRAVPGPYTVVDFCEGRDTANAVRKWLDVYDVIPISSWMDASYACRSGETIWLPELLDSGQVFHRQPFIFLCDQLVQLLDNQYWWSIRQQNGCDDLIVDLCGNVLLFSQLQHSFWPGRKMR